MTSFLFVGGSMNGERMEVRDDVHEVFIPHLRDFDRRTDSIHMETELYIMKKATLGIPDHCIVIEIMARSGIPMAEVYRELLKLLAPLVGGKFYDFTATRSDRA